VSLPMHPLAELFPPMSDVEFATLVADIKENGLRDPIIVHEGMVLDGRNRYRACLEIGIEPMTRPWDGKGTPLDFVVSRNLVRRHLDDAQRAAVSARIANIKRGGDRRSENFKPPIGGLIDRDDEAGLVGIERAAELMNVSVRSVERARAINQRGAPELQAAVMGGGVSLSAAEAVSCLPHDEQREIVSQGPAAIAKAAKVVKAKHASGPKLTLVPSISNPPKPASGPTISVPEGVTVEEQVRKGLALEATGMSQPKILKEIGVSEKAFRHVRDLIVLLDDEICLTWSDRETVETALNIVNQTKQLCGQDAIEPIVRRVWGPHGTPHTIKAARKRIDHFATVVGIAVQSCANFSLKEFEIPYLSDSDRRRWVVWANAQRPCDDKWASKIAEAFDPDLLGVVSVSKPNGSNVYHVIDGQHRVAAVRLLFGENEKVPCNVFDADDPARAAQLFNSINTARRKPQRIDIFRVRVTAGNETEVAVDKIIRSLGYRVGWKNSDGMISAVDALVTVYEKRGADVLRYSLNLIKATWGLSPDAVIGPLIKGYAAFVAEYGTDAKWERMVDRVSKKFSPGHLLGAARSMREGMQCSVDEAVKQVLINAYNHGLREQSRVSPLANKTPKKEAA
jgi:hypothetical protein